MGSTIGCGHYMTYCCTRPGWVCYNDDESPVVTGPDPDLSHHNIYMVAYQRATAVEQGLSAADGKTSQVLGDDVPLDARPHLDVDALPDVPTAEAPVPLGPCVPYPEGHRTWFATTTTMGMQAPDSLRPPSSTSPTLPRRLPLTPPLMDSRPYNTSSPSGWPTPTALLFCEPMSVPPAAPQSTPPPSWPPATSSVRRSPMTSSPLPPPTLPGLSLSP